MRKIFLWYRNRSGTDSSFDLPISPSWLRSRLTRGPGFISHNCTYAFLSVGPLVADHRSAIAAVPELARASLIGTTEGIPRYESGRGFMARNLSRANLGSHTAVHCLGGYQGEMCSRLSGVVSRPIQLTSGGSDVHFVAASG